MSKPAKPDVKPEKTVDAPPPVVVEPPVAEPVKTAPPPLSNGMVKMEVTAPAAWDHTGTKHFKGATPTVPEHVAKIWEERTQGKRL